MSPESAPTSLRSPDAARAARRNVGRTERWASIAVGLAAMLIARKRSGAVAWATRAVGSALVARGASGRSELYRLLGVDRTRITAIDLGRSITIDAAPERILDALADPARLADWLPQVESAIAVGDERWEVTARTRDGRSRTVGVTLRREADGILWSSADAPLPFEAAVRVVPAPGDRGKEVQLGVRVKPRGDVGGALGGTLKGALRAGLGTLLRRLKAQLEPGEITRAARLERSGATTVRARRREHVA